MKSLDLSPESVSPSPALEADLTIRILRQDATSGTAALSWNSESVLVYMIADLVAASHGRTAVETAAMSAHFDSSFQAMVAAKRIQTAILEFLSCRPGDSKGAAMLIHPPMAAGFSLATAESALRLAEPGQIILSREVSERFDDLSGIELRAVPDLTTGGSGQAGLTELIWTSAERLAQLRSRAPALAPTEPVDAPFGATMIVNAPLTARGDAPNTPRPLDPSAEFNTVSREGSFAETRAQFKERRSYLTPTKLAVGAITVVLVGAGLLLFHPWSGSTPPTKHALETAAGESVRPAEPPPGSVPQPPPKVRPAEDSHPKPQPRTVKPPITNKPPVRDKDQEKPNKAEDTPIQGFEGSSTYDGMTQKDIPRLLAWAKSDAGNGNYAKAAQEYRVILELQPGHPEAKEGLRRIQLAKGHEE